MIIPELDSKFNRLNITKLHNLDKWLDYDLRKDKVDVWTQVMMWLMDLKIHGMEIQFGTKILEYGLNQIIKKRL